MISNYLLVKTFLFSYSLKIMIVMVQLQAVNFDENTFCALLQQLI
jgi:hypothetical protein